MLSAISFSDFFNTAAASRTFLLWSVSDCSKLLDFASGLKKKPSNIRSKVLLANVKARNLSSYYRSSYTKFYLSFFSMLEKSKMKIEKAVIQTNDCVY